MTECTLYSLQRTVAPASEPISLSEARNHLRIDPDTTDDDGLIATLITAAREYCENKTNRQFITATYRLNLDVFPLGEICVPRPPLIAVSGITYTDLAGVTQTLSTSIYTVDSNAEPGRIVPTYNQYWPGSRQQPNSIAVTYTAGYGSTAQAVPAAIQQAILLCVGHWYANREAVSEGIFAEVPMAVNALLGSFSLPMVA